MGLTGKPNQHGFQFAQSWRLVILPGFFDWNAEIFAEVIAMNVNESGAIRAGVFVRFHPSKSEAGLFLYSESLAGMNPEESRESALQAQECCRLE